VNAFMKTLSTAGRLAEELASIASAPRRPSHLIVEQWNGREWVSRKLIWDGEQYSEAAKQVGK
jgi:hypothetical protein